MTVNIKFVGALRNITGKSAMVMDYSENFSVKDLIQKIIIILPALETSLVDYTGDVVKTIALILVNDREISVLNGIDTLLVDGDEVVFIPVVHGG
ncbi:MAG: MoaD/ThiS family protein [Nitrososphaerota archaeon]|nr:MoaD/ThiS family protein [Nitrososphaerota archaeon]